MESARLAAAALALNCWVDGFTNLRLGSLNLPLRRDHDEPSRPSASNDGVTVLASIKQWFSQPARRLKRSERLASATLDLIKAAALIHFLFPRQPLFPLLVSSLTETLPQPPNINPKRLRWSRILLFSFLLSLYRETERAFIARLLFIYHSRRAQQDGTLFPPGSIHVKGSTLRSSSTKKKEPEPQNDPEVLECLICSDTTTTTTTIPTSSDALSTPPPDSDSDSSLGPLEAFCTHAPAKHVAHRECFLRWHDAYESQQWHARTSPSSSSSSDTLILRVGTDENVPVTKRDIRRAKAVLENVGFAYLVRSIRADSDDRKVRARESLGIPTMMLAPSSPGSSTGTWTRTPRHLATLRTECPPCPACRSAVLLHFKEGVYPVGQESERLSVWHQLTRDMDGWKDAGRLVTGQTLLMGVVNQLFTAASLVWMINSSERNALRAKARAKALKAAGS